MFPDSHTNELFKNVKILKFAELAEYKTCIFMYTVFYDKLPVRLRVLFSTGNK